MNGLKCNELSTPEEPQPGTFNNFPNNSSAESLIRTIAITLNNEELRALDRKALGEI